MLIKLNRNYLKAMRLVTAKEDVRYYLCGIYFVGGEGKVLAFATDGHQLMRWIIEDNYQGEDFEYIIDRRAIKDAIKTKYDIHLDTETGEVVCSKNEDFRVFKGLIDGKYPNALKVTSDLIDKMGSDQADNIVFSAYKLAKLGEIGLIIGKEFNSECAGIRQYSRASASSIENIFTFEGIDNLMYLVASERHSKTSENEHKAVLTNTYKPAKPVVQQFIDDGFGVLCGISNGSQQHAKTTPAEEVRVIVDYDEKGYMDSEGEIWSYVYFIDAVKEDSHYAKSK